MQTQTQKPTSALDESRIVQEALGLSTHQLFVEAYSAWYGHAPNTVQIDRVFGAYLQSSELPFFVRHYVRSFVEEYPEYVLAMRDSERRAQRAQTISFIALVAAVAAALALA